jgi:hypothetical protein
MDKELLFILVIIITVVINIMKAVNKKKAQSGTPSAPPPTVAPDQGNWQEVLKQLMGEAPAPKTYDYEYPEEAETLETIKPLGGFNSETYDFSVPNYSVSSLESMSVQPDDSEDDSYPKQQTGRNTPFPGIREELAEFDLRRAVIYSTLLNRPYS